MVLIFQGIFVYSAFMECLQLIGIVKTEMVRGGGRPQGAHGMQTGAATRKKSSAEVGPACVFCQQRCEQLWKVKTTQSLKEGAGVGF